MSEQWVREYSNGTEYLDNLGGVSWADAPKPWRWHRCKPQTRGFFDGELVERCACGAVSFDGDGFWIERNQRRRPAPSYPPSSSPASPQP